MPQKRERESSDSLPPVPRSPKGNERASDEAPELNRIERPAAKPQILAKKVKMESEASGPSTATSISTTMPQAQSNKGKEREVLTDANSRRICGKERCQMEITTPNTLVVLIPVARIRGEETILSTRCLYCRIIAQIGQQFEDRLQEYMQDTKEPARALNEDALQATISRIRTRLPMIIQQFKQSSQSFPAVMVLEHWDNLHSIYGKYRRDWVVMKHASVTKDNKPDYQVFGEMMFSYGREVDLCQAKLSSNADQQGWVRIVAEMRNYVPQEAYRG